MATNQISNSPLDTSLITEDLYNGSGLEEPDLAAIAEENGWEIDLDSLQEIDTTFTENLINKEEEKSTAETDEPAAVEEIVVQEVAGVTETSDIEADSDISLSTSPEIVEDWEGGYKLELGITAESAANDWNLSFNLPYEISEVYGVDLVTNDDGSYTISGQNDQVDLQQGQSIQPIFIVNDNGQSAVAPQFDDIAVVSEPISTPVVEEIPTPETDSEPVTTPVDIPANEGESVGQQGKFAYGEALQKNFLFWEANRSGALGPDNRLEWRRDSTTNDGSTVGRDLEGGYFDAGDHVKFGQPMAASVNMLAWGGVEYTDAYKGAGQFDELLDAVKWGTDYFLKAHETSGGKTAKLWVQVGEGGSANDHGYWGAPETVEANTTRRAFAIDPANPGSDVAASTSSALAAASMLFRGVDDAYADELLKNAK